MKNHSLFSTGCILLTATLCFITTSCLSKPSEIKYCNYTVGSKSFFIQNCTAVASINQVSDEEVAIQMQNMISSSSIMHEEICPGSTPLVLSLTLNQRPFYNNMSQLNSISLFYTLCESDGTIVFQEGYYLETKGSLLSATQQFELISHLVDSCAVFLEGHRPSVDRG